MGFSACRLSVALKLEALDLLQGVLNSRQLSLMFIFPFRREQELLHYMGCCQLYYHIIFNDKISLLFIISHLVILTIVWQVCFPGQPGIPWLAACMLHWGKRMLWGAQLSRRGNSAMNLLIIVASRHQINICREFELCLV